MAKEEEMIIQPCPMNGGDGAYSYSQYSVYQTNVVDQAKQVMQEVIRNELDFNSLFPQGASSSSPPNLVTFRIADFGCSTGPATFTAVQNILEAVNLDNSSEALLPLLELEFQVFFSDQTNNDFNTLFRSLPTANQQKYRYFAAGVPGSFYGRLFPKASLHFGCISTALHWLSRAPAELTTPGNVDYYDPQCYSKGSIIHCTGFDEQVVKAYSGQFTRDMDSFFDARAEEIVTGGLLAISTLCLPDGVLMSQTGLGLMFDLVGASLMDVAKLGLISQDKMDSFYMPVYFPRVGHLESAITKNGCFTIQKIEKIPSFQPDKSQNVIPIVVPQARALSEELIIKHFQIDAPETVDLIFERFTEKISTNISVIFSSTSVQHEEAFILAKRL